MTLTCCSPRHGQGHLSAIPNDSLGLCDHLQVVGRPVQGERAREVVRQEEQEGGVGLLAPLRVLDGRQRADVAQPVLVGPVGRLLVGVPLGLLFGGELSLAGHRGAR